MQILNGKEVAAFHREKLQQQVALLRDKNIIPELALVLVGEDPAAVMYAASLQKAAQQIGITGRLYQFPDMVTETMLCTAIQRLNNDPIVYGIIVFMPLPEHISAHRITNAIKPEKDVDGLTETSMARLFMGKPLFVPCTPKAVMAMLAYYQIPLEGKEVAIIGRSNVVGKPLSQLCLQAHATVTICHSHTRNLEKIVRRADVVIAAVGKAEFITADMIKPGSVVLDVGINRKHNQVVGDVDFASVSQVAGAITPVPGGIGAVTTIMMLENILLFKGDLG